MDIDYIISGLLLAGAAVLAAYLLGHARGRLAGFNACSRIWAGSRPVPSPARLSSQSSLSADILDAEDLV